MVKLDAEIHVSISFFFFYTCTRVPQNRSGVRGKSYEREYFSTYVELVILLKTRIISVTPLLCWEAYTFV